MKFKFICLALLVAWPAFAQFTFSDPTWLCQQPPLPPSYSANAATFDGSNDYLVLNEDFTGTYDSTNIVLSFWFKRNAAGNGSTRDILVGQQGGQRLVVLFDSANLLDCQFLNTSGSVIVRAKVGPFTDENWNHFIISFNTGSTSTRAIYTNGVAWGGSWTTYSTGTTVDVTPAAWVVGASYSADLFYYGCLSEVWFSQKQTTWFDITDSANLQKFRTVGGKPVDLGTDGSTPTGTAPLLYLKSVYTSFNVNSGTGGNLTTGGSLDSCTAP